MKTGMKKYVEMCIIKKVLAQFEAYMKINRNLTQTQRKGIRKN